jgi:hypothetical protein
VAGNLFKVGFTGTRNGMTDAQRETFKAFMGELAAVTFHHGACKGADADAAFLTRHALPDAIIIAHPGQSAKGGDNEWLSQEALDVSGEVRKTKNHFARNRDIVDETDFLIACPPVEPLPASGGTTYTVRYAIKKGKPVRIIWPDGRIEER